MRKTKWLVGIGIGFLLGSKAGPEPYQQTAKWARQLVSQPKAQGLIEDTKRTAGERLGPVTNAVRDRLPGKGGNDPAASATATVHPDQQDLQFGTAAARKEELADRLVEEGADPEMLPEAEAALRPPGDGTGPRAGNKA